jgi:fibronectin type 3 domain-containing protein
MKHLLKLIKNFSLVLTLLATFAIFSTACQQPKKAPVVIRKDPNLPVVKKLQALSDMSAVALEWFPLSDYPNIKGYNIYRVDGEDKLTKIGTIDDKTSSHFVDTNLQPNTRYFYKITSLTNDNRESEPSMAVTAQTSPMLNPIHYIIPVANLAKRAKLLWRPHNDPRVAGYVIERNSVFDTEWRQIAYVKNRLSPEFIDKNLQNETIYKYRVRVKTYDNLISEPSKVVEVVTKALPKPVRNIQTTFELPREIKISWKQNDEKDVVYYKIYKSLKPDDNFKFFAKTEETTYTDSIKEDGLRVFYNITAVDKDGLEGPKNTVSIDGSTLARPQTPRFLYARQDKKNIFLKWESDDNRIIKYKILKTVKEGWGSSKTISILRKQREYLDKDVVSGVDYIYKIVGIDKHGIESKPTEEKLIFIKTKEGK